MMKGKSMVALFDLDGVIMDTETQYSRFWSTQCAKYRPDIPDLANAFKGQTLNYVFDTYFTDSNVQRMLMKDLSAFEKQMRYDYIPGAYDFIQELHEHDVKMAVVTSSDLAKMANVIRSHPELDSLFDRILTSEDFPKSKPAPDCYLLGAKLFSASLDDCVVFEDSFNGLKAGMDAGIFTIGLATTNKREDIRPCCHHVIDDFRNFHLEDLLRLIYR
ncbi:MAG: HAD family hydrolase [Bacteroidaceae bacterium]|nr:HAD family hydrolase [Bacteroidaceae bacterium]MCF0185917.1 HAD family hydrolase [Bacteroidaceae bacterium]